MREKGRNRKEKKILIRVSKDEKDLAEQLLQERREEYVGILQVND